MVTAQVTSLPTPQPLREAAEMYERLRNRGRSMVGARLSVLARYSNALTTQQRQDLHKLLTQYEQSVP